MAYRPRLDKKHGFLNHITRNQIERKTYHEERLKEQRPTRQRKQSDDRRHRETNSRYQSSKRLPDYMLKPDKDNVVFTMSIEYCPSKIAILKVHKDDDPDDVAKEFTNKYGMREDLMLALSSMISQRMGK